MSSRSGSARHVIVHSLFSRQALTCNVTNMHLLDVEVTGIHGQTGQVNEVLQNVLVPGLEFETFARSMNGTSGRSIFNATRAGTLGPTYLSRQYLREKGDAIEHTATEV